MSRIRAAISPGPSMPRGGVDPVLAATAVGLLGVGVVMVFSASAIEATVVFKDPQYFLKRQVIYAVLSMFLMWACSRLDYRRLQHALPTYTIYGGVMLALLACVIGLGKRVGGASRWIAIVLFTSSPPRWRSFRSCSGWPIRSRKRAIG
ncbi:MAG: FtsW/RodA/SpoVE family cell cycle protein [Polyangiaceae bacterium]